jgi:hypothetical protein
MMAQNVVYDCSKYLSKEATFRYFKLFSETLTKDVNIMRYIERSVLDTDSKWESAS